MKKILLILSGLAWTPLLVAQVSGTVITDKGEPLPFVNVLLLQATDSTLVTGNLSAADGSFRLEPVRSGRYRLQLSLIGYRIWYSEPFVLSEAQPVRSFGLLRLAEETVLLNGVLVTARKMPIEQTPEGTTVNVQSSLLSKGSTALQMLERSPGVVLDQRNGNLTLNGQSGTLVMINGKPIRLAPDEVMRMLEGMSADNLEKVELLTNPSVRHDADGSAGIINLVLRKNENEGTNGSASVSAGYGWGPKSVFSLNLNHRRGTTNYFGSYAFSYDNYFTDFQGIGSQDIPVLGGEVNFDFKNNSGRKRASHNFNGGVEKELGQGFTMGGNVLYNHSIVRTDIYNDADYVFSDNSFLQANINVSGRGVQQNLNTSLFVEKRLGNGGRISFDTDYIGYQSKSPSQAESAYRDRDGQATDPANEVYASNNRGESTTNLRIGVAKLDAETRLSEHARLEGGWKASYSTTTNNAIIERFRNGEWSADDRNRSQMRINEKIAAAYLSLHLSLDSLTTLTAGLRYEHWDRDFSQPELDQRFGKFFPSAFLNRNLSSSTSLQLAYNRRITRPDYNDLTHFLRYNDPTSVFTGTPELQPAVSDNLKLSYQFADKNIGLVYIYETNPIARFQIVENDRSNLVIIAPRNVDFIRTLGVQAHLPWRISPVWSLALGGTVGQRRFALSYTPAPIRKDYLACNMYLNQTFALPRNYAVEVSGLYHSTQYNGSVKVQGYGALNLGVKKELGGSRGSLQFTVTDLLQSMTTRSEYGALTREAFNSRTQVKFQPESANARIFRLTYSRQFGNNKASKHRQAGSPEEKSRIGQ